MSKKYSAIPTELLQAIVDYLATRPVKETMNLVLSVQGQHVPDVEVGEKEEPDGENISD